MTDGAVTLRFVAGTLLLRGLPATAAVPGARWDPRSACHRAPAALYAELLRALVRAGHTVTDEARAYRELPAGLRIEREPRPYQAEALAAWEAGRGRGVVVLPTGAGKTHVALMAVDRKRRSTLVVAPTLDLVRQWYDQLRTAFGVPVGVVGGGEHRIEPLTVTTYDSAFLQMEHLGARFGLVVFDECHHLPGEAYSLAARFCLAPFRLGLTATPERADGRERDLDALVGPVVYRQDIVDLSGEWLAEYEALRIVVRLTAEERREHDAARALYLGFLRKHGIRMNGADGWGQFVKRSSGSREGRDAMAGYRRQRQLAFAASQKLACLGELLDQHGRDRAIVFTQDNATAYAISREHLVPAITHQTKVTERSLILSRLAAGTYGAVVTSRVLNEGIDVPDANVAVVVSGSGSVREHVQRLGRILRKRGDKRAVLYELVTADTAETGTSERRRDHVAYR